MVRYFAEVISQTGKELTMELTGRKETQNGHKR